VSRGELPRKLPGDERLAEREGGERGVNLAADDGVEGEQQSQVVAAAAVGAGAEGGPFLVGSFIVARSGSVVTARSGSVVLEQREERLEAHPDAVCDEVRGVVSLRVIADVDPRAGRGGGRGVQSRPFLTGEVGG